MTEAETRAAKHDITEVLVRYATGIDRRAWDLFRTCFTDDCHADYGDIGVWQGVDALTEFMVVAHEGAGHTLHGLTNNAIAVDGERAVARTYVDAIIMAADGRTGLNPRGWYDDELVRTDDGWRIARRRCTMVHFAPLGE
ncbi:MAG: nuclear transport factor 2 family protein [Acidimicrobiia bacterium]